MKLITALLLLFSLSAHADLYMPIENGRVVVSNKDCPNKYDDGFDRSAYVLHEGKVEKGCWQSIGKEYYIRMYEWQPIGIIHFSNYYFNKVD